MLRELVGLAEQCVEVVWTPNGMEDQLVKKIVGSKVRGVRLRGRPQTGLDGQCVKRVLNKRNVCEGRMIVNDRSKLRAVVNA